MKLKFGSIVSSGAGKLGGHFCQSTVHGSQLSAISFNRRLPSSKQLFIRNINKQLQAGWRALSISQRSTWNDYEYQGLSGHSIWMSFQFTRLFEGLPFLSNPANHLPTYLGVELIKNGQFQAATYWQFGSGIIISGGKCTVVNTTNTLRQNIATILNEWYRAVVVCDSLTQGQFDLRFSQQPSVIFNQAGTIEKVDDCNQTGFFLIRPNGGAASGVFSSVSFKQIYNYFG